MEYYSQRDIPCGMAATLVDHHTPDPELLDQTEADPTQSTVRIRVQSAAYFIGNILNAVIIERITRWRGSIEPPY